MNKFISVVLVIVGLFFSLIVFETVFIAIENRLDNFTLFGFFYTFGCFFAACGCFFYAYRSFKK